jgi:hypothetical protein
MNQVNEDEQTVEAGVSGADRRHPKRYIQSLPAEGRSSPRSFGNPPVAEIGHNTRHPNGHGRREEIPGNRATFGLPSLKELIQLSLPVGGHEADRQRGMD